MTSYRGVIILILLWILHFSISYRIKGCLIVLNSDLPKWRSPLYIRKNRDGQLRFLVPSRQGLIMEASETISFVCPGENNHVVTEDVDTNNDLYHPPVIVHGRCASDAIFTLEDDYQTHIRNITCFHEVQPTVVMTGNGCVFDGMYYLIGYDLGANFLTNLKICYNADRCQSDYAIHTLHGETLRDSQYVFMQPGYREDEISSGISLSQLYMLEYQRTLFQNIFGSEQMGALYINNQRFLVRGHLVPARDFQFLNWKYSTYFEMNTAPMWNVIADGNWRALEITVREIAARTRDDYYVMTGTFGILKLPGAAKEKRTIYLQNNQVPVRKYFWKIIRNERTHRGMGFFLLNNPFVEDDFQFDICVDICYENGYTQGLWKNPERGLVICCTIENMFVIMRSIPRFDVTGIMQMPNDNSEL